MIGTEVRVNGARIIMEENLERILKPETEGRASHGFNSNKNIGLSQEGGTCATIFGNLSNRNINTEHNTTGLGILTYLRIQGKEGVSGRLVSSYIP